MNTEHDTIVEDKVIVEPGTLLKEKREALGLTQQQVADRLRLRLSIIQNLEENRFNSDLVATFIRGYLRSYAKAVGVKESEILEAYETSSSATPQEQTMQSFSKKTKRAQHDSRIMIITWGILIILIGMSSLWWWQNHRGSELDSNAEVSAILDSESSALEPNNGQQFATVSELTEESGEEPVAVPAPADEADAAEAAQDEMTAQPVEGEDAAVAEEPAVAEQEAVNYVESPASASDDNTLTLTFSADCWIQVKDALGKTLSTGIKQAGQTLSLRGQKPFQVILGAPEGVAMTFASEPVDLSGYTSGKVARFTLP